MFSPRPESVKNRINFRKGAVKEFKLRSVPTIPPVYEEKKPPGAGTNLFPSSQGLLGPGSNSSHNEVKSFHNDLRS